MSARKRDEKAAHKEDLQIYNNNSPTLYFKKARISMK